MKISGFVTVMEKDKSGNIIQVAVEDNEFNKHIIINDKTSEVLFKYINNKVQISADVIDYDFNERPILVVKKITHL